MVIGLSILIESILLINLLLFYGFDLIVVVEFWKWFKEIVVVDFLLFDIFGVKFI